MKTNPDVIVYTNIKRFDNTPFEQYLQLEGLSHSFLKSQRGGIGMNITETDNMTLGKLVDGILLEPKTVNMASKLYPVARKIAATIRSKYGQMIQRFSAQVSYTADMNYKGFVMKVKGRLDMQFLQYAVIDLKVTQSKDVHALIDYMGYKNQLWHYCKLASCPLAYIFIHSVPTDTTHNISVPVTDRNEFWEDKIVTFGKIAV